MRSWREERGRGIREERRERGEAKEVGKGGREKFWVGGKKQGSCGKGGGAKKGNLGEREVGGASGEIFWGEGKREGEKGIWEFEGIRVKVQKGQGEGQGREGKRWVEEGK